MEKVKHTPGPWRIVRDSDRILNIRGPLYSDRSSISIADIADVTDRDENARLIAAAPELREALETAPPAPTLLSANAADTWFEVYREWRRKAEAAMQKARGE